MNSYFINQIINDTLSRNLTRSIFITSDSHKWSSSQLLEICTILIPNALLVLLTFPFGVLIPMQRLLIVSMGNMQYVGGLIIGVEIVKFIKYIKNRKEG